MSLTVMSPMNGLFDVLVTLIIILAMRLILPIVVKMIVAQVIFSICSVF